MNSLLLQIEQYYNVSTTPSEKGVFFGLSEGGVLNSVTIIVTLGLFFLDKLLTKKKELRLDKEKKEVTVKIMKFNLPLLKDDLTSSVAKFEDAKNEWIIDRSGNYTKLTIPKGTVSIIEETGYEKLFQTFQKKITDANTKTFSKFWNFVSQFEQNKNHIEEYFQYLVQTRAKLNDQWNSINLSIMNEI